MSTNPLIVKQVEHGFASHCKTAQYKMSFNSRSDATVVELLISPCGADFR